MWDAEPKKIENFFPQNNITYNNFLQEVHYSTHDVLVPEECCLVYNVKLPIWHRRFLNSLLLQSIVFRDTKIPHSSENLITSATYSLSSLISVSNCDDTKLDYIIVNSENKNLAAGISNSILGSTIALKTLLMLCLFLKNFVWFIMWNAQYDTVSS